VGQIIAKNKRRSCREKTLASLWAECRVAHKLSHFRAFVGKALLRGENQGVAESFLVFLANRKRELFDDGTVTETRTRRPTALPQACCVISAMHEIGISPDFAQAS
jgi:hypothetical protein